MEEIKFLLEEQKKTNKLLEKLLGLLQAAAEPDESYHQSIVSSGTVRIPGEILEPKVERY